MFNLDKLKAAVGDIGAQARQLRASMEKKKQERDLLLCTPPPRTDVIAILHAAVDLEANGFPDRLAANLKWLQSSPCNDTSGREFAYTRLINAGGVRGEVRQANLAYLFREPIKQALAQAVNEMDWPKKVGPPVAERGPMIEKLDEEIAKLQAEHAELRDAAAAAGVHIDQVEPALTREDLA